MYHSVSRRPIVALLTDFGSCDGYTGIMKGVMLGIVPDLCFVDITHDIAPQQVAAGAWVLAASYRYFPSGTIFLCVVDPGVGSRRRPIAVAAGNWLFVGPDNGLFSYVLAEQPVHEVVALTNATYHLAQVSATFHGRDLFAPVSAHLANGVDLLALGPQVDPSTLERLPAAIAVRQGERIEAYVAYIDHFGNLITNIPLELVPELFSYRSIQLRFPRQEQVITERQRFFASATNMGEDEQQPFIYGDSSGYVAVAVRNGNAAQLLNIDYGSSAQLIIESSGINKEKQNGLLP